MPTEVNTPDQLEYKLYPAPGGCFTFKVRSANDAHIALLSENGETGPMFEVFIGGWGNTKSVIRKNKTKPDVMETMTPNILHPGEFRGFWIRWNDSVITVGKEGETSAFLAWEDENIVRVNYVGICTGWGAAGTWLIDEDQFVQSGPVLGFAPPRSDGAGCWVPAADGAIPPGAVEGGFDGSEQLYIARAVHEGSLIPGKLHPSHGVTYVSWGGGEHGHNEYEVLCGTGGMWIPSSDGQVPDQAVPAGESDSGEPLFIGRANHNGCIVIGKVQPSHGCCYIPYGGEELSFSNYEVFVTN